MSTLETDDKFLVQRGDDCYQVDSDSLMSTIEETDWLLVNRGDDSYRVSGKDVKEQLGTAPEPPGPDGAAGPITAVSTDQLVLTVGSDVNLNTFNVGDTVTMINRDGTDAAYVPRTSEIQSIPVAEEGRWTRRDAPTYQWKAVTYGNGRFVAMASSFHSMVSTDGLNWTDHTTVYTGDKFTGVAFGKKQVCRCRRFTWHRRLCSYLLFIKRRGLDRRF